MLELRCDGPLCGFLWQISCLHGSTWTNTPATTHRGRVWRRVATHTHTHTYIRDGDREALCFRLSIDDIFVIDNRGPLLPPFVSIMVFSLSNGGRFFDRGVARANFVIHWFRCSDGAGVDCWGNCCDTQGRVSREFGYLESLSRIFGSKYDRCGKGYVSSLIISDLIVNLSNCLNFTVIYNWKRNSRVSLIFQYIDRIAIAGT